MAPGEEAGGKALWLLPPAACLGRPLCPRQPIVLFSRPLMLIGPPTSARREVCPGSWLRPKDSLH